MRSADVFMHGLRAGLFDEVEKHVYYRFVYDPAYTGPPVSLTLPVRSEPYTFDTFPAFLEGLLPEGFNLAALLRARKIDRNDLFSQLLAVGDDLVGALTLREGR